MNTSTFADWLEDTQDADPAEACAVTCDLRRVVRALDLDLAHMDLEAADIARVHRDLRGVAHRQGLTGRFIDDATAAVRLYAQYRAARLSFVHAVRGPARHTATA